MHFEKFKKFKEKIKGYLKKIKRALRKTLTSKQFLSGCEFAGATSAGVYFLLCILEAYSSIAGFIILPIEVVASGVSTMFAMRDAYCNKKDRKKKYQVIATLLTTIGIAAGMICSFIGIGALSSISNVFYAVALGGRGVYELLKASYHWIYYIKFRKIDPAKAAAYRKEAIAATITFFCFALGSAAFAAVTLTDQNLFYSIGLAAGVGATVYAAYVGYQHYQKNKANHARVVDAAEETDKLKTNNAKIHWHFISPSPYPSKTLQPDVNLLAKNAEDKLINELEVLLEKEEIPEDLVQLNPPRP